MDPTKAILSEINAIAPLIILIVVTSVEIFKKIAPKVEPLWFSIPYSGAISLMTYFAVVDVSQPWSPYCRGALIIIGGLLTPSGLFSVAVTMVKKAAGELGEVLKIAGVGK